MTSNSASIEIHIEQCKQLWVAREELKPKHERRGLPSAPKITPELLKKLAMEEKGNPEAEVDLLRAQNEAAYQSYNTVSLHPCEFCGRTFLEEK